MDRLGLLAGHAARAGELIVIDHHASNTRFGTVNLIDPDAAATAVLALELIAALGVALTRDIALGLYAGLVTDTGSFKYSRPRREVHELAARLLSTGIEPGAVARELWDRAPFGYLGLLSAVLGRAVLEPAAAGGHGLVWTTVTRVDRAAARAAARGGRSRDRRGAAHRRGRRGGRAQGGRRRRCGRSRRGPRARWTSAAPASRWAAAGTAARPGSPRPAGRRDRWPSCGPCWRKAADGVPGSIRRGGRERAGRADHRGQAGRDDLARCGGADPPAGRAPAGSGTPGTLDPMATGVLVVGVEKATRLLGHLTLTEKEYLATIRLGQATDTDDAEGTISSRRRGQRADRGCGAVPPRPR